MRSTRAEPPLSALGTTSSSRFPTCLRQASSCGLRGARPVEAPSDFGTTHRQISSTPAQFLEPVGRAGRKAGSGERLRFSLPTAGKGPLPSAGGPVDSSAMPGPTRSASRNCSAPSSSDRGGIRRPAARPGHGGASAGGGRLRIEHGRDPRAGYRAGPKQVPDKDPGADQASSALEPVAAAQPERPGPPSSSQDLVSAACH